MEDNKVDLEKNTTKKDNDDKNENKTDNNKINIESKNDKDIENKINAMLNMVMDDQDNNDNSKNDVNKNGESLKFNNDEEENSPKTNKKPENISTHFDRGSKRLKTVAHYPVNMMNMNMPIMDINRYNNNFTSMRAAIILI